MSRCCSGSSRAPSCWRADAGNGRGSVLWWLTVLFVLWTAVSYVLTRTMNYGFDEVAQTAALALLFLWMARHPEGAKMHTSILRVLVVTVLVASLIGVLVYALGPLSRFVGTFLDIRAPWKHAWPNAWAELLLLSWPIALLLARPQDEQGSGELSTLWKIARRSLPAGVMVGCLLLSFSRAAFLVFLGQSIVLLLWSLQRRVAWRRAAMIALSVLAIGLIFFGLSNHLRSRSHPVQSLSEKALFLAPEGSSSVSERRTFWTQAFRLANEHPLFGSGPGSFRFVQTPLMRAPLATSDHAHNLFLKLAAERGWMAAALAFTLLCIVLLPLLKGLLPAMRCPLQGCPFSCVLARIPRYELTLKRALLLTAVLGVLAHNLVDFNLHFIAISLPTVLILAMLPHAGGSKLNKKFVHIAGCALAVVLLFATVHESFYAATSTLARRADAQGKSQQALRWYRWSTGEWYSRDRSLALARLQMKMEARAEALATIRRYTQELNPADVRGWHLQAEIALAGQDTALAMTSLRQAYDLGRYADLRILQGLLPLLALQSNTELAERKAEFSEVLQKYYDAILRNSHYIALSPNVEAFVDVAELMAVLYPSEAPRYQVMAAGVDRQARTERQKLSEFRSQVIW